MAQLDKICSTYFNNKAGILSSVLFANTGRLHLLTSSGGHKGGYWGYLPPPRILGVNTPLES